MSGNDSDDDDDEEEDNESQLKYSCIKVFGSNNNEFKQFGVIFYSLLKINNTLFCSGSDDGSIIIWNYTEAKSQYFKVKTKQASRGTKGLF